MASLSAPRPKLTAKQRHAFTACFLGWTLDAFDFFILTYTLSAIAADFRVTIKVVAATLSWTLAMRPVGAFLFGALAERIGRRPTLMINVVSFCIFELASAFAPSLMWLLVFRAFFGIAMGGEWGVGAALAFESLPTEGRGFYSGLLQEGYVTGNLLAGLVYWLIFPHLHGTGYFTNWRVMFLIGVIPAFLVLYIRSHVEESPAWKAGRANKTASTISFAQIVNYLPNFLLLVALMTAFISFSHGSQDLYPTLLEKGKHFSAGNTGKIAVIASLGAFLGGITFGTWSERIGRKRAIITAALLTIPMIPLWAYTHALPVVALGGFLMQFMVQGAWGVIPAHLNELSPASVRAIFPGLAYQLGALFSAWNGVFQAGLAQRYFGGSLAPIMALTIGIIALVVALLTGIGKERRGESMDSVIDPAAAV